MGDLSFRLSRIFWATLRPDDGEHEGLCEGIETALWNSDDHRNDSSVIPPIGRGEGFHL